MVGRAGSRPVPGQAESTCARRSTSAGTGWAHFGHVLLPEYRWGIFVSEPAADRRIGFGELRASPRGRRCRASSATPCSGSSSCRATPSPPRSSSSASWGDRAVALRPAQPLPDQRRGGPPPVGDGVPPARLLRPERPRGGRRAARTALRDRDNPRILGAFNEATPDWLSFFMFTYFTDRDGKYQLGALRESAFDPLARTCDFMLKEEAHHMFVGNSGISRVVQRTAELMTTPRHRRRAHPSAASTCRLLQQLPELPLRGLAGPVRLGGVDQRRQLLRLGAQGPDERGPLRRRPCACATTR